MRTKKPAGLASPSGVLRLLSHAAMGTAMGLGFALFLIFLNPSGIANLVEHGGTHAFTVLVGTLALTFGIGATLTGVVFLTMEDD
ncbi:MAG TPA: hypothetical protein VJV58_07675 [Bradyrhizobium sp.]|jgi:hypothetical protein|uniref:hypothetical protein n=1 Tax=Bradyrhizobium sp. TaxID=376 RepID=UPI002B47219F|nr:hypothetical protein [Bradyrhizobium sp.]HKO70794.1 hypothetical protein [Bradyrhizobium sp.]